MDKKANRAAALTLIRLLGVLFEEQTAGSIGKQPINLDKLFETARRHRLTAAAAAALQKIGIIDKRFKRSASVSRGFELMFDAEWERLSAKFKEAGIAHFLLKGMTLKQLYPAVGLREMSDMDILFDSECAEQVREIMEQSGYRCVFYDVTNEDVYKKPPVYAVEMHRELFNDDCPAPLLASYYRNKDFINREQPGMTPDETYLYLMSHLYMHYVTSGTGLRSLLDIYVFLKHYHSQLDFVFIENGLTALGVLDFEKMVRNLALKFLTTEPLSPAETDELDYFIDSGVYGTKYQYYQNRINETMKEHKAGGKLHYIRNRFKVSPDMIQRDAFYSRHRKLSPLMRFTRPVKAIVKKPKKIIYELRVLKKTKP